MSLDLVFLLRFNILKKYKMGFIIFKQNNKQQMSIYSGFATRNQQQFYNNFLWELLYILSERVVKLYRFETVDQLKFTDDIKRLYLSLYRMEKQKYLEPKFSKAILQLCSTMQIESKHRDKNKKSQSRQSLELISYKDNKKNYQAINSRYDTIIKNQQNLNKRIDTFEYDVRYDNKKSKFYFDSNSKQKRNSEKKSQNDGEKYMIEKSMRTTECIQSEGGSIKSKGNIFKNVQKYYLRAYKKHKQQLARLHSEQKKQNTKQN